MTSLPAVIQLIARKTNDNNGPSNCTLATCTLDSSYYSYRVSLGANVAFLVLFSLSIAGFIVTYAFTRRAHAFTFAFVSGITLEILGYVGRIISYHNQWNENGFLLQIICLTIAPAFLAGGIYLCLRRIVYTFGPQNSRISPEAYTRIFIPCDFFSLVLQALGGGMASTASHNGNSTKPGDDIMVAGLAFQVLTLAIFMALCTDFYLRTKRRHRELGAAAYDQSSDVAALRNSWMFKGFLYALGLATICIFWRSTYRVVELAEGWNGSLIKKQNLFIGFEGVMVIIACLVLNFFHPAITFGKGMEGLGGLGTSRKQKKREAGEKEATRESSTEAAGGPMMEEEEKGVEAEARAV